MVHSHFETKFKIWHLTCTSFPYMDKFKLSIILATLSISLNAYPGALFIIGQGFTQVCTVGNFEVPVVSSHDYPGYAEAKKDTNGTPYILYNPSNIGKFPKLFQDFTFFHECAHIRLGHVHSFDGTNRNLEREADCESIRFMDSFRVFERDDLIEQIQEHFKDRNWLGSGTHDSSNDRSDALSSCFSSIPTGTELNEPNSKVISNKIFSEF